MKKGLLLALFGLCSCIQVSTAQLKPYHKMGTHFIWPGFQMTLSNHHITIPGYEYADNEMQLPFEDLYMVVYGAHTILSAFKCDSLTDTGYYEGTFFADSSLQDRQAFPIAQLQVRTFRNDTLLNDWQYIPHLPFFKDTAIRYKAPPHLPVTSYWLLNEQLKLGDCMLIELRRDTATPFFRLHLKREDGNTQPFLMSFGKNDSLTEAAFISDQLMNRREYVRGNLFYEDWPGSGLSYNNTLLSPKDNMVFYFRNRTAKDSIFVYRIVGGRYTDTTWRYTDGTIFMTGLSSNSHYRLDIKFADDHGQSSVYTFYTTPLWYQTLWCKVITAALLVALLLLWFLVARYRKNKRRLKYHQLEMQALHAQMNPHFLFNALSSIQGLMNDQQTDKANKYLSGFAALLRSAVSQGRKELVPLSIDLKDLNNYIALEQLRFGFRYEQDILPGLPADDINVPPLLAQPLIENAAKHGLSGKRENGLLTLQITRERSDLLLIITDNGNGFNPDNAVTGHGIALTKERIALFNRMYRHRKIILTISSTAAGTRCSFRFSNWIDDERTDH